MPQIDTSLIHKFLQADEEQKTAQIAVVGDMMLDEYYNVQVERISPEYSVAVHKSLSSQPCKVVPGGAANVAYQTTGFNTQCRLYGRADDEALEQLTGFPFSIAHADNDNEMPIPRKKRFYDGNLPLSRWDVEDVSDLDGKNWTSARRIISYQFVRDINQQPTDIVILSDYNKGLFHGNLATNIINRCREAKVPVIVDPKKLPLSQWYGCAVLKLNYREALYFTELISPISQCKALLADTGACAVIITQGGKGVWLGTELGVEHYTLDKSVDEKCVIGAGDCFAACLGVCLARNIPIHEAVQIAYLSGAAYIQDKHNQPVDGLSLLRSVDPIAAKIISAEKLAKHLSASNTRNVMTNGCFDLGLTNGHVECLKYAKSLGDVLIVAINNDDSVQRLKGHGRPIVPLKERMNIIASLQVVDFVVSFDEDTPINLIQKIQPNVIVKGGDYKPEDVAGFGTTNIIISPTYNGITTTDKIQKIIGIYG